MKTPKFRVGDAVFEVTGCASDGEWTTSCMKLVKRVTVTQTEKKEEINYAVACVDGTWRRDDVPECRIFTNEVDAKARAESLCKQTIEAKRILEIGKNGILDGEEGL